MSDSHLLNTNNIVNLDTYLASNYVTQDTAQTISGAKTFSANPQISVNSSGQARLTFKNAVTTYGSSAVDLGIATSNGLNQFLIHFQEGNKWATHWDQDPTTKEVVFSCSGCTAALAPTPPYSNSIESTRIATIGWSNISKRKLLQGNIVEIPSDINITLLNGTLTIKSGSKVYDGTGAYWTTSEDVSRTCNPQYHAAGKYFIVVEKNSNASHVYPINSMSSKTSQPSVACCWYNPDTGETKWSNDGTTWSPCSLPLCIFTSNGTTFDNVEQILNGISYIDEYLFVFPGITCVFPNGRLNGYEKNCFEITTTTFKKTHMNSAWGTNLSDHTFYLRIYSEGTVDIQPDSRINYTKWDKDCPTGYYFFENKNLWYWWDYNNKALSIQNFVLCASFKSTITSNSFKLSDFKILEPPSVLTTNDLSRISLASLPSDRVLHLTLGASGSTYTAPANGWVTISKNANTSSSDTTIRYLYVQDNNTSMMDYISATSGTTACIVTFPVYNGEVFNVIYNATGSTVQFSFIYAQGEV